MFLTGYAVAIVNFCITKMTITYLPMIGILYDTIILASTQKELKHSYIKEEVPKMLEIHVAQGKKKRGRPKH